MNKVLFIDHTHPLLPELLSQAGMECVQFQGETRDDLLALGDSFKGFVIRSKFSLDRQTLMHFPSLRFIGRVGAGMESIDQIAATELGIACLNSPEGNRDSVAEHALGMILALFHKLCRADHEVRQGLWQREKNRGIELRGKTVGIIGYGNMGRAFAYRLKSFGVEVLAYDKYLKAYGDAWAREADMEELFDKTDILSLHIPLTAETRHLVDEGYISRFAKNIFIINTARGPVINTSALVEAMKSGKVRGACLDVLEYENVSFNGIDEAQDSLNYLKNSPETILTPHVAGWSAESEIRLARILADKITARFS